MLTFENESSDYSQNKTFLMPTDVVDLCPGDEDDDGRAGIGGSGAGGEGPALDPDRCKEADHSLDKEILSALRRNLVVRGISA